MKLNNSIVFIFIPSLALHKITAFKKLADLESEMFPVPSDTIEQFRKVSLKISQFCFVYRIKYYFYILFICKSEQTFG